MASPRLSAATCSTRREGAGATGREQPASMAGRVAGGEQRREAGKFLAVTHAPDAVEVRLQVYSGARAIALDPGLVVGDVGSHPELRLSRVHDDLGVRVMRLAGIVDQAVGVVGMQVRHDNVRDGGGLD